MTQREPTLRERRAEKRRIEILDAALEVLSEDGYASASMDRIAERALLTRVGLYKHFRDKASLMTALREHKLLELAERVKTGIAAQHDPESRVRAIVRETVQYQRENQGFFRVLLASSFSNDLNADTSLKPFLYAIAEVMMAGIKAKRFRQADALDYAAVLAGLIFVPSIKRAFVPHEPSYEPSAHLTDLIADVFLHGVAK